MASFNSEVIINTDSYLQEFMYFMSNMGMQFSEEEVTDMIQEVDVDGNGEIDYEEFVKMMSERWSNYRWLDYSKKEDRLSWAVLL